MAGNIHLGNLLGGWQEWQNVAGQPFYHNPATQQTSYSIPANCVDQPGVSESPRCWQETMAAIISPKKLSRPRYGWHYLISTVLSSTFLVDCKTLAILDTVFVGMGICPMWTHCPVLRLQRV